MYFTYSCWQAEASKNGPGGSWGSGGSGGSLNEGGRGGGDNGRDGDGGAVTTGAGTGTGLTDAEQNDIGLAGWETKESTTYISMSNNLNINLRLFGGPPAPPHSVVVPSTLPPTVA